jgi:hypothetical protein
MRTALIELQFLPPISYFALLSSFDEVILERCEHYIKQSYRNRCYINTPAGKEMLPVPITSKSGKVMITDVKIDYDQKWLKPGWRKLQSAYGKAPFFEHYADELHAVLFKKFIFLYDLNLELLSLCLKWLDKEISIRQSERYEKEIFPPVYDHRNHINPKNAVLPNKYHKVVTYPQVFGSKFVPNLSLLDLIFCMGPDAILILRESLEAQ